ncbi:alpha/beta hydrolase family protein [Micromonospora zamorensis]|uniref:alpha/beta hydrolase family protein n=1 Tax=Micromonospora zamorensis TaxID=709883 RepID=UPI003D9026EC
MDAAAPELAWHPHRPLVAGLAVEGRRLYPWVADHASGVITHYRDVSAATSLTAHGGRQVVPLAWIGRSGLALLTVPEQEEPPSERPPAPTILEATGPGFINFAPSGDALHAAVSVHLSLLDVDTRNLRPLTPPLVVGRVVASPSGRLILLDHLGGEPPESDSHRLPWQVSIVDPTRPSRVAAPAGSRWAFGDSDVIAWRDRSAGATTVRFREVDGGAAACVRQSSEAAGSWLPLWHRGGPAFLVEEVTGAVRLAMPDGNLVVTAAAGPIRIGRSEPAGDPSRPGRVAFGLATLNRVGLGVVDLDRLDFTAAWLEASRTVVGPPRGMWSVLDGDTDQLVIDRDGALVRCHRQGVDLVVSETLLPPASPSRVREQPRLDGPLVRIEARAGTGMLRTPVAAGERAGAPVFLWLRAASGEKFAPPPSAPATVVGAGHPVATLDLALEWPEDATVASLHGQIVGIVRQALAVLTADAQVPVVVGGHSFGATLALYALAEVPELAAAVVHSGCYNRTLTWGGFQHERRSYWQAPDIYREFSALLFADRLRRPVLIAHGADDANPATPPEQAVDLYRGIVAAGGTARLVLLPKEGHTFHYRENLALLTEEHCAWLGRHLPTPQDSSR